MAQAQPQHPPTREQFHFDGVTVDVEGARLLVDGRERPCSQRAFKLLTFLCASPGKVLQRQDLLDHLWPGGQVVGDEALTQAVFRARACLGPYGDRIATVRGIGIRLDAKVSRIDADSLPEAANDARGDPALDAPAALKPAPATDPDPVNARVADDAPARIPAPLRARALLLVLIAVAAVVYWWVAAPTERSNAAGAERIDIDVGYGVVEADAFAALPESLGMLRDAFGHEGRGDRPRASALMETVHASDPTTPVPALFLALWAIGSGDAVAGERWLQESRSRAEGLGNPYMNAMIGYVDAERAGTRQAVLRFAGAVLDLRPQSWQMRLARVHMLIAEGYREAALAELALMNFGLLEHRKQVMALADRASLGDIEGAERELERISASLSDNASLAYLRGRIAWSRGDLTAARDAYEETARLGEREARFDLANRSIANAGVIALLHGDDDRALRLLERARMNMQSTRWTLDEIDISLILAQLHGLAGDTPAVEADVRRAEAAAQRTGSGPLRRMTLLYRARLLPGTQPSHPIDEPDVALQAMLAAHRALADGDTERARAAYAEAERRLQPRSPIGEELRWLAARLGEPLPEAMPVDPPFPPLARLATRAAIERMSAVEESP